MTANNIPTADWSRRFARPLKLRDGTTLVTLEDAAHWIIKNHADRNEFERVTEALFAAARGGSVKKAREAMHIARNEHEA